jgi:hypothetical protein
MVLVQDGTRVEMKNTYFLNHSLLLSVLAGFDVHEFHACAKLLTLHGIRIIFPCILLSIHYTETLIYGFFEGGAVNLYTKLKKFNSNIVT